MKIHFDKLYKDDRISELLGIGIPFPKGKVMEKDLCLCKVVDEGKELPSQIKATSTWEDGSVRFCYVRFLGDLPGNKGKDFDFLTADEASQVKERAYSDCDEISIEKSIDGLKVSNGQMIFKTKDQFTTLFENFFYKKYEIRNEHFKGPFIKVYGHECAPVYDKWSVFEEGKIFSIVECQGHFQAGGHNFTEEGLKFSARISVTAGKPWVDIAFRLINCTDDTVEPEEFCFLMQKEPESKHITTTVGISNYKTSFESSDDGEEVSGIITAEKLEKEANEHFAEVIYGTFLADVTDHDLNIGVCATVFQAQQNFPKAISARKDRLKISLIPDREELSQISNATPVRFESGMSREQRFLLHFHDADLSRYEINNRSIIYQMPDTGYVDPEVFAKAQVFPDIFLPVDKQIDDVEIALIDKADAHARCYGMMCWGDAPDPGYTAQGRGNGDLVWTNNEYDYPHAMYMMYARTGIRRMLDYANVASWHWMDVDICHYNSDPIFVNGQWEHMRRHTGGSESGNGSKGIMACSHEWVEGLIDNYHFTGDERAIKAAIGIGENVLALLDTPMYQEPGEISARETGWALRSLTALYVETHEKRWLTKADWIIGQFEQWNERYGHWLSPYTDNTTIRVGFMISVAVGSLMRYYRVFPSDRVKELIMGAVDDIVENCRTPQGLFYYKELPSLSRNGGNTLLLESMAIGYELTGDDRYLDYGLKTFRKAISGGNGSITGKRIVEDTVIVGNGAPKNFAQSFLPITIFYVKSVEANKLLQ